MNKCTVPLNAGNAALRRFHKTKMVVTRFDLVIHFYVTSVNKN